MMQLLMVLGVSTCLYAQVLQIVPPENVGFSGERLARIKPVMERAIANGEMAGGIGVLARRGKIAYFGTWGMADKEANKSMTKDAIFRIFSMTKLVTGVAVMTLYEEGRFTLHDPVSKFLPEFKQMKVASGNASVPAEREIKILDLLRHTSGLNYAGTAEHSYEKAGISASKTLAELNQRLASVPLVHQPGTRWDYSYSMDVLARLVEVVSGKQIDEYFAERIFKPLNMVDTAYYVPEQKWKRLAVVYTPKPGAEVQRAASEIQDYFKKKPILLGGGSGLVSTAIDYARLIQMLLNGGELDGVRILAPKTVELIHSNHLGNLPAVNNVNGRIGYGFGFTVAVNLGMDKTGALGSEGEYNWGGAAGTAFWIDPKEDMIGLFLVQVVPQLTTKDIFKQLAYQALVGGTGEQSRR
jgi:CubicO group peptidase (beta-lactamase class C family)